jgi:hypothetical protein
MTSFRHSGTRVFRMVSILGHRFVGALGSTFVASNRLSKLPSHSVRSDNLRTFLFFFFRSRQLLFSIVFINQILNKRTLTLAPAIPSYPKIKCLIAAPSFVGGCFRGKFEIIGKSEDRLLPKNNQLFLLFEGNWVQSLALWIYFPSLSSSIPIITNSPVS